MRIPIATNNEPVVLAFKVRANGTIPLRIRIRSAYHNKQGKIAFKPDTNYTDRAGKVSGERTFYVRMPKTPEVVVAEIYNPTKTKDPGAPDNSFQLVSKDILPLDTFPREYDSNSELLQCAIDFVQYFSENAGIFSAGDGGSVYKSLCGRFRIDYLDVIRDRKTGEELATPARISQDRGIIEVSKKHFLKYAVPYRVAILLHEVSHFYVNDNPRNEVEADLNALKMFLGLGYGYIDAENAFLNVFKGTPSDQNKQRHQILHNFIMDFEKRNNKYR
jgi:hypothetical protein